MGSDCPISWLFLLVAFIDTNLIQEGQLIDNIAGRKNKTVEQFRVSSISTRHLTLSVMMDFVGSSLSRPFVHVTCAVDQSLAVILVYFFTTCNCTVLTTKYFMLCFFFFFLLLFSTLNFILAD